MLRLAIVLPIYLAVMYYAPNVRAFEAFASLIQMTPASYNQHLIDYGAALALAALLVWTIQPWTAMPGLGPLLRILRMGLLGVIAASAWQIFCLVSGTEMSAVVFVIPLALALAEFTYELIAAILQREPTPV